MQVNDNTPTGLDVGMYESQAYEVLHRARGCRRYSRLTDCDTAIKVLMGSEWDAIYDFDCMVRFRCTACKAVLNSLVCARDHNVSHGHLKILQQTRQDHQKLMSMFSERKAVSVGLQMIEEHITPRDYFIRCRLCSFTGNVTKAYFHIIGDDHIDCYLKRKNLIDEKIIPNSVRLKLVKNVLKEEGTRFEEMKIVKATPKVWGKSKEIWVLEDDGYYNRKL